MATSFTSGDGPDPLLRHISLPYFVPKVASNEDAFCRPHAVVQYVSSSVCCLEVVRHPRGPMSYL